MPVLFHTGGAHGIRPSELSPLERHPVRYRPKAPTYRFPFRHTRRQSGRPDRKAAVSGLSPFRESLADWCGFSTPAAGCSLGLRPSRACRRKPWSRFRSTSSHALLRNGRKRPDPPAPQSIDRLSPRPVRPSGGPLGAGWDNPSRVRAPNAVPSIRTKTCPGYVFTLRRVVHYCRPPGDP